MKKFYLLAKRHPNIRQITHLPYLLGLLGFFGGFVNGLLGTGGGILLLYALHLADKSRPTNEQSTAKDAFASVLLCTLPLSILSLALYFYSRGLRSLDISESVPYLIGAIFGGALGAFLLDRLQTKTVRILFALLLLFAGWRMAFA